MKLCPECGAILTEVIGGYMCHECGGGMFSEEEVISPECPRCGSELGDLIDEFYCFECSMSVRKEDAVYSRSSGFENDFASNFDDVGDEDYDSMIGNGDSICLNCTYWSVSPYGSAYGMVCRRGYMSDGPGDSCSDFVPEQHFASYGDDGQYQFNETGRAISNKLYHWKNNR